MMDSRRNKRLDLIRRDLINQIPTDELDNQANVKMTKFRAYIVASVSLIFVLLLSSCSSGVSITTSRLSGIIIDTSMVVDVGMIGGNDAAKFREELLDAVRSNRAFGSPSDEPGSTPGASLLIEGTYGAALDEAHFEEKAGEETKKMVRKTYVVRFEYRILDRQTGDLVIDGALEESDSNKEEEEGRSFLGAILHAIVEVIILPDPYASLREQIIDRFVGEISPHEMKVALTLFEDSDMPELETGIGFARVGRWKDALGTFLDAIEKRAAHKNLHKVYYDAGVAYEYDHQYSLAWEFLERALQMSNTPEYATELQRCRRYEQEWKWREGYLEKLRMMRDK